MGEPIVVIEEFWVLAAGRDKGSHPVFIASQLGPQGQWELTGRAFGALQFKNQDAAERRLAEFARKPPVGVQPERYRPMHIHIETLMSDAPAGERA